ncbi:MAG: Glyoxalase/bleomycin resistance protein/dioxygenase, partial [Verrucomicrobiales bacterium]|nr:Glyoxalase/bleomycin resistance protein/dioxygenase [Verrucomicrobiales bacterium]
MEIWTTEQEEFRRLRREEFHEGGSIIDGCDVIARGYALEMKVRKLLHTRYRLNDLERSIKFYKEVLGLEELRRHKSPRGSELVFMKAPESEELIELCHFPNGGDVQVQPDLTHLAFLVDSLE